MNTWRFALAGLTASTAAAIGLTATPAATAATTISVNEFLHSQPAGYAAEMHLVLSRPGTKVADMLVDENGNTYTSSQVNRLVVIDGDLHQDPHLNDDWSFVRSDVDPQQILAWMFLPTDLSETGSVAGDTVTFNYGPPGAEDAYVVNCSLIRPDEGQWCDTLYRGEVQYEITVKPSTDTVTDIFKAKNPAPVIPDRITPATYNPKVKKASTESLRRQATAWTKNVSGYRFKATTPQTLVPVSTLKVGSATVTDNKKDVTVSLWSVTGNLYGYTGYEAFLQAAQTGVAKYTMKYSKGIATYQKHTDEYTVARVRNGLIVTVTAPTLQTANKILAKVR